jgi:tRNA(Ile)-lysidine synthase
LELDAELIQLQGKLDREVYVACSGGVDSIAVVNFLSKNHKVNLVFFNHGTPDCDKAQSFILDHYENSHVIIMSGVSREKDKNESLEEYWRNERYVFLHAIPHPVITCHNLDDCVETWIWSSLHGEGKIIPYQNKNVIRPFRMTKKAEFVNWCASHNIPWYEDSTNASSVHMRNYIRHEIVPKALVVNPGLYKVIGKKVKNETYK